MLGEDRDYPHTASLSGYCSSSAYNFQDFLVCSDVVLRHARIREALLNVITTGGSVDRTHGRDRFHGLFYVLDDVARLTVSDDFRHRTATKCDDWRSACHGFH